MAAATTALRSSRPTSTGITKPAISQYAVLVGPTYRFYLQPRYSVSGRVMAGYAQGNFSGDTNGFGTALLGLYPDGSTFAVNASIFVEYNLTPSVGIRIAPEYYLTGFGSTEQNSLGFTSGIVYGSESSEKQGSGIRDQGSERPVGQDDASTSAFPPFWLCLRGQPICRSTDP